MAPPTLVPPKNVLKKWHEAGLTAQEMADLTLLQFGNKVSRSGIAQALSRHGLTKDRRRYVETVPWKVNKLHATARPLRMLRLLGRRRQGIEMSEEDRVSLDNWLEMIRLQKVIVAYDPDDVRGFHYVDEKFRDHKDKTLPIRKKTITINP